MTQIFYFFHVPKKVSEKNYFKIVLELLCLLQCYSQQLRSGNNPWIRTDDEVKKQLVYIQCGILLSKEKNEIKAFYYKMHGKNTRL